ncbi:MAG: choice-of-anchor D domain-containing protein [Acidobacteriota bacterium]
MKDSPPVSVLLTLVMLYVCSALSEALAQSSQDADLTIDPVVQLYPVTTLGTHSGPQVFKLTNLNAGRTRALGALSLDGPNADQFVIANDACSGVTLAAAGGSCTVQVKFHPTSRGTKAANLLVPSDDPETRKLTAFLGNHEATADEARRRMPPVLVQLSVPETMRPGETIYITWSLEGYHLGYTSNLVMFDCTATPDCGASFGASNMFAQSGNLGPDSVEAGRWEYNGTLTQRFNYSWIFTVPATRADGSGWPAGGTSIVIRFYCKDNVDIKREGRSVSLLIPGNLTNVYYDTSGRRIVRTIAP